MGLCCKNIPRSYDPLLSFEGLYECMSVPGILENQVWVECQEYVYDKSLQPGALSWRGEEWNSVVSSGDCTVLCTVNY